jgi:hypothetical protein
VTAEERFVDQIVRSAHLNDNIAKCGKVLFPVLSFDGFDTVAVTNALALRGYASRVVYNAPVTSFRGIEVWK